MTNANYISGILFDGQIEKRSYLHDLPVIRCLRKNKQLSFSSGVTFFVGENGMGKSGRRDIDFHPFVYYSIEQKIKSSLG